MSTTKNGTFNAPLNPGPPLNLPPFWKEESDDGEAPKKRRGGCTGPRNRPSIYQKLMAIKEMDRLIEAGHKTGIEKKVMATFPNLFAGAKSGMLGRDLQRWREIPFERLAQKDRESMKELHGHDSEESGEI